MGCASSKVDDLPAVALCRDRCTFLDEAIHQRYALAAAHMAYINSLKGIGRSLHHFVQQERDFTPSPPPKAAKHASPPSSSSPPHSDSGHLHFHSDSDGEDALHLPSGHSSPLHLAYDDDNSELDHHLPYSSGYNMRMNFMKKQPTPSVVYQQRPMNPETVYVGESSSSSYPYPYPYPYPQAYDPYSAPPPSAYYGAPPYYGSSSPHRPPPPAASSSKSPPPPPSPPRASAWDFLNFFDNDDKYYSQTQYTPSRDSREVREEEGIPDLEDEDYQREVVKEVHGDQKLVDAAAAANNHQDPHHHQQPSKAEASESGGLQYEVHVVDKKVMDDDDRPKDRGAAAGAAFPGRPGSRNALEVAEEIERQFQRASDSGTEIAKMLEVGKLPYNRRRGAYQG